MPIIREFVDNELVGSYYHIKRDRFVSVFKAYKDDDWEQPLEFWFSPYGDSTREEAFDIRELNAYRKLEAVHPDFEFSRLTEAFRDAVLELAVNTGELDRFYNKQQEEAGNGA